jgi:hypothetical protein
MSMVERTAGSGNKHVVPRHYVVDSDHRFVVTRIRILGLLELETSTLRYHIPGILRGAARILLRGFKLEARRLILSTVPRFKEALNLKGSNAV